MKRAVSGLVEHTMTMASSDPATKIMALRREPIFRSIQPARAPARAGRHAVQQSLHDQRLGAPVQDTGSVDAAETHQHHEPFVVRHAGDQEDPDIAVVADPGQGLKQVLEPFTDGGARAELGGGRVRGEEEQRQAEDQHPHGRQDADGPFRFVQRLVESEQRVWVPAPREQEEQEQDDAKGIAQCEAHAAPEADFTGGNVRQHGIAEDGRVFVKQHAADDRGHDPHQTRVHSGVANHSAIMEGTPMAMQPTSQGLRAATGIGNGAQNGCPDGHQDGADRAGITPDHLAVHRI